MPLAFHIRTKLVYVVRMSKSITICYFAWLRERIGVDQETVLFPDDVNTVEALINYLCTVHSRYTDVFFNARAIRCAINHEFAHAQSMIRANDEVAFFPPVTGG